MFYYRKNNQDGSFEIKSSQIQLDESEWFEIPKPISLFTIWDEETQEWI